MPWTDTGNKANNGANGVSTNMTLTGTTAGNLVVVITAYAGNSAVGDPTITDGGNTWTKETTLDAPSYGLGLSWSILTTGGTRTINSSVNGVNSFDIWTACHEFAGAPASAPKSGTPATNTGSSSNPDTTAMTPADNDVLVVAACSTNDASRAISENVSPGDGGWTLSSEREVVEAGSLIYKIITGVPGTPRAAWNFDAPTQWYARIIAFKPAGGAAGPNVGHYGMIITPRLRW